MVPRIVAVAATAHELAAIAAVAPGQIRVGSCASIEYVETAGAPVVVLLSRTADWDTNAVARLRAQGASVVVVMEALDEQTHRDLAAAGATDAVTRDDLDAADPSGRLSVALRLAVAERQVRALEHASTDAASAMSDFSRLIIHDIRGALSTMGLACDVLRAALEGATAVKYVGSIERAVTRTGDSLDYLGDLTAIETGRTALARSKVDARVLLDRARDALADKAGKAGAALITQAPDEPVMVELDSKRITQAMTTLAEIALVYSTGAPIELGLRRGPDNIVFSILAPDLSVAADQVPHLCARVWRGPAGTGSLQHGAALAVAVAVAHGGFVDVRPAERGTSLDIAIPAPA